MPDALREILEYPREVEVADPPKKLTILYFLVSGFLDAKPPPNLHEVVDKSMKFQERRRNLDRGDEKERITSPTYGSNYNVSLLS